jgi:hypothetical protein
MKNMKTEYELFIGKNVVIVKQNGFVLRGKILKADENGCLFETWQKISYFDYKDLRSIVEQTVN